MANQSSVSRPLTEQITAVLLSNDTSSRVLRQLYRIHKASNQRFSIPFICKHAGIPSIGYFSDVMQGKRRLHKKHTAGILRTFKLKGPARRYLKTLILIENEKTIEKRKTLQKELDSLRKVLAVSTREHTGSGKGLFFALEIFCAIGIFGNSAELTQIKRYFSQHSGAELDTGISMLEDLNLVRVSNSRVEIKTKDVNLATGHLSAMEFLTLAFQNGIEKMEQWYGLPHQSLFSSTNISVKASKWEKALSRFRDDLETLRVDTESNDADMLVRLNCQFYPIS